MPIRLNVRSWDHLEDVLAGLFKQHIGVDDETLADWKPTGIVIEVNGVKVKLRCLSSREFAREAKLHLQERY